MSHIADISLPNPMSILVISIHDFWVGHDIFNYLKYTKNLSKILETELNVIPANYKNKCRYEVVYVIELNW